MPKCIQGREAQRECRKPANHWARYITPLVTKECKRKLVSNFPRLSARHSLPDFPHYTAEIFHFGYDLHKHHGLTISLHLDNFRIARKVNRKLGEELKGISICLHKNDYNQLYVSYRGEKCEYLAAFLALGADNIESFAPTGRCNGGIVLCSAA